MPREPHNCCAHPSWQRRVHMSTSRGACRGGRRSRGGAPGGNWPTGSWRAARIPDPLSGFLDGLWPP
eukprot:14112701-Alexandrium_andersonii.AAC.1